MSLLKQDGILKFSLFLCFTSQICLEAWLCLQWLMQRHTHCCRTLSKQHEGQSSLPDERKTFDMKILHQRYESAATKPFSVLISKSCEHEHHATTMSCASTFKPCRCTASPVTGAKLHHCVVQAQISKPACLSSNLPRSPRWR